MKKMFLIILALTLITLTVGCSTDKKEFRSQKPTTDNSDTTINQQEKSYQTKADIHRGEGYTLAVPTDNYRYEKDYDDGNLEEKWEHKKYDDTEIKVTTYKNSDELTARNRFLMENDDYIFEDLTGYTLCGTEVDGDALCFNLYKSENTIYIVSWEYSKHTDGNVKNELSEIATTFTLTK